MNSFGVFVVFGVILITLLEESSGVYTIHKKRSFIVNTFCPRPGGIFSLPGDCNGFVTCTYGRGCVMNCPKGLHFSPHLRICTTPEKSMCRTDPLFENIPPPPHCSKGYMPAPGELVENSVLESGNLLPMEIFFPEQPMPEPQAGLIPGGLMPIWFPEEPKPVPEAVDTMSPDYPEYPEITGEGQHPITFPDEWPTGTEGAAGQPEAIPEGDSGLGGTVDGMAITFPEVGPWETAEPVVEHVSGTGGLTGTDEILFPVEQGQVGVTDMESEEDDSEEATFEDWQEWIEWFNENRKTVPMFMVVPPQQATRTPFRPDPRLSQSWFNKNRKTVPAFAAVRKTSPNRLYHSGGNPKVPVQGRYMPNSNSPRSFYFHHKY